MNIEEYYSGENKDIINSILILNDLYNNISLVKIHINNIIFGIRINDKYYNIKNESDLKNIIENYYNIKELANYELYDGLEKLIFDYMNYKNMFDEDKVKIYLDIYPLIDEMYEKYKILKSSDYDIKEKFNNVFNLNYNGITEYLSSLIIDMLDKK